MCTEQPHLDQAALPRLEEEGSTHTPGCPARPPPSGQTTHQAPHVPDPTTTSLPKLFDPVYTDTIFSRLGETAILPRLLESQTKWGDRRQCLKGRNKKKLQRKILMK